MGVGAGLIRINAALQGTAAALTGVAASARSAAAALGSVQGVAAAIKDIIASTPTAGGGAAESGETASRRDPGKEYVDRQLGMLAGLAADIAAHGGPDASGKWGFATIINDQISKVRRGDASLIDAIHEIQRQFSAQYTVLQQEYLSTKNPELRDLYDEILRFIASGVLNPDSSGNGGGLG
jgi:hypothetical protein